MADLTAMHTKTIEELIKDLSNTAYATKENAAIQLAEKGALAKESLTALRQLLSVETDLITKSEFLKAIIKIEPDINILVIEFEGYVSDPSLSQIAFEALTFNPEVAKHFLDRTWKEFDDKPTYELGKVLIKIESDSDKDLVNVQKYIAGNFEKKASAVLLLIGILYTKDVLKPGPEWVFNQRSSLTEKVWNILKQWDDLLAVNYSFWALQRLAGEEEAKEELFTNKDISPWKKEYLNYAYTLGLDFNLSDEEIDQYVFKNENFGKEIKLVILLENYKDKFSQFAPATKNRILEFIIDQLKDKNAQIIRSAVNWLKLNLNYIPPNQNDALVKGLEIEPSGELIEDKKAREDIIKKLKQRKSFSSSYELVIKEWKSKNIDEMVDAIINLLNNPSKRIYISLFDTWQEWIVLGRKDLIESLFEEMGNKSISHNSIQYLVRLLDKDITKDKNIRSLVEKEITPEPIKDIITGKKEFKNGNDLEFELNDWINELKEENESFQEIFDMGKFHSKKELNDLVNNIINEFISNRQLQTRREISQKLAEMSDDNLIAADNTKQKGDLDNIKVELRKYTVPVIAKKIISEKDTEIRENYTRILGNVGGRESVDALTRAISGDERNRSARQDLLSKYYLEPSKTRSEEAATMLKEAIVEAKKTLRLLQYTNTITFGVGIILLVGGVIIAVIYPDIWTKLVGAFASLGGLAGIIIHLLRAPLDRIQTAMANLVQIETAFTSFIWELNLNGTYIQSQYVAEGVLQDKDIAKTISRIEGAMGLAMNLVSVYTHNGKSTKGCIKSVSPPVAKTGTEIRITGDYLKGINAGAKGNGMIVIDNEPVDVTIKEWNDYEVNFIIPDSLAPAEQSKIYKISLLVDGIETNSLPLKLVAGNRV